jgi:hypothetical protein
MSIENEILPEDTETHQISFTSPGLSIDQEIVIPKDSLGIDNVIAGLNSGELNTTLDHDVDDEEQWIRDSDGNGVAVILSQKVTVIGEGFKDFIENKD